MGQSVFKEIVFFIIYVITNKKRVNVQILYLTNVIHNDS